MGLDNFLPFFLVLLGVDLDLLIEFGVDALQLLDFFLQKTDLLVCVVLAEAELTTIDRFVEKVLIGLD